MVLLEVVAAVDLVVVAMMEEATRVSSDDAQLEGTHQIHILPNCAIYHPTFLLSYM